MSEMYQLDNEGSGYRATQKTAPPSVDFGAKSSIGTPPVTGLRCNALSESGLPVGDAVGNGSETE